MILFAIANVERGVIGIHSFHDPARGLTSVGFETHLLLYNET
jgi:hypothetical protein